VQQVRDQINNETCRLRIRSQTQIAPLAEGSAVGSVVIQVFNQISLIRNMVENRARTSKIQQNPAGES
jgi:hypothetical protein